MSSKGKLSAATGSGATLVPKLRFPEFQGSEGWKEVSLQRLARPVADRAATGDADNILSLSGEHGLVLQSDYFGKKIAGDSTDRYLKISRDDFVYNDRTTKSSNFGTIKRLSIYSDGIVSPIYKCFRFHSNENPVFWEWYFESGSHDPALGGLVNEGARAGRFNIAITKFLSTNVWRPEEAEQQKIADCLDSADALIAARGRKVEALKAHKKGLMQQLFPQKDETQPRLRFPEFAGAGEWKFVELGKLLKAAPDYGVSAAAVPYDQDLPKYLRITDISENGRYLEENKVSVDLIPKRGDYLDEGDIAIARTGASVGKSYRYRPEDGKLVYAGFLIRVRPDQRNLMTGFLAQFMTTPQYWDWISVNSARSGQPGINSSELSSLPVPLPADVRQLGEQQRIADCLTYLDEIIKAETQNLDTLKTHKKGLMQQLFPKVGESDA